MGTLTTGVRTSPQVEVLHVSRVRDFLHDGFFVASPNGYKRTQRTPLVLREDSPLLIA